MSKRTHSAAPETSRERIVFIDIEQQMLDLEALRKKVAEAERRAKNSGTRRLV